MDMPWNGYVSWQVIIGKIEIFIQIIFPTKEFQLSNKNINKRLFTSTDFPKALFIINTKLYKT